MLQITVNTQISDALGEFNMRRGAYSRKYGTKRCYNSQPWISRKEI